MTATANGYGAVVAEHPKDDEDMQDGSAKPETKPARLVIERLTVEFRGNHTIASMLKGEQPGKVRAVDDVSFEIAAGETLGLVGESGSGKTTVGRALLRLNRPSAGRLLLDGDDLTSLSDEQKKALPRRMQMVFQDPYGSLNPRRTVRQTLGEVLSFHQIVPPQEVQQEVLRLMALVGLSPTLADRRPKGLSGGQRQRVGLARALAVRPSVLVLDEPVAALDVSIQAQVLNLLEDLRKQLGLTMLFIAHELGVVRHISDRVAVMYLGHVMEIGTTEEIFAGARHPYTISLLKAMPRLIPEKRTRPPVLQGEVPSPFAIPSGCRFRTRCPVAQAVCEQEPPMAALSATHSASCHFAKR
jgi:oligopeptide/dipeptide ABC transporter ATP-binding protein